MQATPDLHLDSLSDGIMVVSANTVGWYVENCVVCFDNQGHSSGVCLNVIDADESEKKFSIHWEGEVSEQLRRSYADLRRATDQAACAIAFLLIRELTHYKTVEQAIIGTSVDYWLSDIDEPDDYLIFNHTARLEISGILSETKSNSVEARMRSKLERLKKGLPAFIIIVEFGRPWSKMGYHEHSS